MGLSQLGKLTIYIKRRQEITARYNEAFASLGWLARPHIPAPGTRESTSWHLYSVRIDFERLGKTRTEVMAELSRQGVGSQVLYIPVHLQPWYRETYGYGEGKCPVAEKAYEGLLSLPLFPAMGDDDVSRVIEAVKKLEQQ